jgi:hypothetical protein
MSVQPFVFKTQQDFTHRSLAELTSAYVVKGNVFEEALAFLPSTYMTSLPWACIGRLYLLYRKKGVAISERGGEVVFKLKVFKIKLFLIQFPFAAGFCILMF